MINDGNIHTLIFQSDIVKKNSFFSSRKLKKNTVMLCERPSFSVMVRVASVIIIPLFLCAPIGVPKDVERTADDKGGDGACVVRSNLVALRLSADALFVDLLLKFQPNVSAENIRGNKRRRSNLVVEMGSVDGKLTNLAASLGFDVVMKSVFDETDRVDNLVKQHALILKVDVKGKELPALLGASNLLKMNKVDVVIFSLWPLHVLPVHTVVISGPHVI